jgi:hypothetical protein
VVLEVGHSATTAILNCCYTVGIEVS